MIIIIILRHINAKMLVCWLLGLGIVVSTNDLLLRWDDRERNKGSASLLEVRYTFAHFSPPGVLFFFTFNLKGKRAHTQKGQHLVKEYSA